ncbi:E3 ubiquitin-protein ligase PRT1 [Nicotiana tomentosiformis]|uniref:E3 ubiquitin-protein ligase PRT1 n=1 Tax=Nicotiana tomentosiformis TaxID=4098 RepID=UPI00051C3EBF|nr:E3 ubiquitin-protein ligase PRT1 [Nicotiana tomentosiformis]
MENGQENHENIQTEEIPDEFQCCVCLELLYKPVVLGCGHIACFWCIFKSMNTLMESNCPICRHPYHHFPSVCRLMHFLLVKLYPLDSARREKQVAEEEKEVGYFSPQFDDYLSESCGKTDLVLDTASPHSIPSQKCGSAGEGEHSSVVFPAISCSETKEDAKSKNLNFADEHTSASSKQVLITDLLCGICKLLLYRPVVLNCGHVYCENCVINPSDKLCRCPGCQLEHPNGYPNVCLVLEHFLEEQFPKLYAERKSASVDRSNRQIPATRDQDEAASCKSLPKFDLSTWLTGGGPQVHFGVGCDYCGMYPIVGERYKCKDCKEKIGFDLCEGCYKSSSKLPGRFNQQHTPEHQFDLIQPLQVRNVVLRLQPERLEEDGSIGLLEYIEEDSSVEVEPQHAEEDSSETNSPRDDLRDGQAGNISSNDTREDQGSANRN